MSEINYINGDATYPIGEGNKIIVHICNDVGGWGAGFVVALSKKWDKPEKRYREWYHLNVNIDNSYESNKFELGNIQEVAVEKDIKVINMIAQHQCWWSIDEHGNKIPPIRYEALRKCLEKVYEIAKRDNASVHMPRIGSGLAGGDWEIIEDIINETLVNKNITTIVYNFNDKQ